MDVASRGANTHNIDQGGGYNGCDGVVVGGKVGGEVGEVIDNLLTDRVDNCHFMFAVEEDFIDVGDRMYHPLHMKANIQVSNPSMLLIQHLHP